jgi:toxin-antitoxin system PIN domain toxin
MLVDANILLFATDRGSRFHRPAAAWLADQLNGPRRVGLPWHTLSAFLRIATNPRAYARPMSGEIAWRQVEEWLAADAAWIPAPTERHAEVFGSLVRIYDVRGNLVPDAELAALAIQHGLTVCSADTDFARFREVRWENPIAGAAVRPTPRRATE